MASGLETVAVFARPRRRSTWASRCWRSTATSRPEIAAKIARLGHRSRRGCGSGIGAGFTKRPLGVVREGLAAMRAALPGGARVVGRGDGPEDVRARGRRGGRRVPELDDARRRPPGRASACTRARARPAGTSPRRCSATCASRSGRTPSERLLKEESFYRQLHQGYIRHFEALERRAGYRRRSPRATPSEVGPRLAEYEGAIDHVVVRALAHADVDSLGAVAEAAAPGARRL